MFAKELSLPREFLLVLPLWQNRKSNLMEFVELWSLINGQTRVPGNSRGLRFKLVILGYMFTLHFDSCRSRMMKRQML